MLSKALFFNKTILILLAFTMLSSCSWWGGSEGNKSASRIVTISNDNFDSECLTNIDDFFIKYFRGLTTRLDINDSAECIQNSMNTLFRNAEERDAANGFTRKELVNILSRVWAQKSKNDIARSVEIMFLAKRLLIGGRENGFSRDDLVKFNQNLPLVQKIILNSNEHIRFWFFDRYEDKKIKAESLQIVSKNMVELDALRALNNARYTEEEAHKLLDIIFSSKGLKQFYNLIFIGYDIVFGNEKSFEKSHKEIFKRVHDSFSYLSTLRAAKFSDGLFKGEGLSLLFDGMYNVMTSLSLWSETDENYFLPTSKLEELIVEAYRFAGDDREENPLASTVKRFLDKFLQNKNLRKVSFEQFKNVLLSWYAGQREVVKNYNPENSEFSFENYSLGIENISKALTILDSVRKTEKSHFVLNVDGTSQYIYNRDSRDKLSNETQYYDLSLKNLLAHVAFRAYETYVSRDALKNLGSLNASKKQVAELLLDIRPLAIDRGITNPYSCAAADNFMMEANLFTNSGNGDQTLSFIEGIELVFMSISAGDLANKVYDSIDKSECELDGMTYLGNHFMDRECVKKELFGGQNTFLSNFSEYSAYYSVIKNPTTLSSFKKRLDWTKDTNWLVEFKETSPEVLHETIFDIVNGCDDPNTPITKQGVQTIVGLSQYIENWFSIYDNTGQGLYINRNWFDEEHFDYVVDGAEFRQLYDERLVEFFDDYTEGWNSRITNFAQNVVYGVIGSLDLDRYRAMVLLGEVRKKLSNEIHEYQKLFCTQVNQAVKEKKPISYNDQLTLKCDGTDAGDFNKELQQNR